MRILRVSAAILAGLYLSALAGLVFIENKVLYRPSGGYTLPWAKGLHGVKETFLPTPDGNRLVAWHSAAKPGQPTLLYFHGNAGNLASRASRVELFQSQGWGVFMLSYRSFSGSSGIPSEANNVADGMLAYEKLMELGVSPANMIVYGESLGTGVAVQVASRKPVAGLVLDAPYTSIAEIAETRLPIFPVRAFMQDRYESDRRIGQVHVPVLILHGEKDEIIPAGYGKRLAELAPEPKTLVLFAEGDHSNLPEVGGVEALKKWLDGLKVSNIRSAWLPADVERDLPQSAIMGEPVPLAAAEGRYNAKASHAN